VFKLVLERTDGKQKAKEVRFFAKDSCSRQIWVKKLIQAKNASFEAEDCGGVPLEQLIALQAELDHAHSDENDFADSDVRQCDSKGARAYIDLEDAVE